MDLRPLGRTGVQVSRLCLGAMMFGSWGNPDPDECTGMERAAFHATSDAARARAMGESVEQAIDLDVRKCRGEQVGRGLS